jgi:hypothetical protein
MKTLRVYVDTSVFGGYFEEEFQEWSRGLIHDFELGLFIPVVSDLLTFEIERAPQAVRDLYREIAANAERIITTNEAETLAARYAERAILGSRYEIDMIHIALATVAEVDVLVSWNFKHMVRLDKIRLFNAVNLEMGYRELRIHSPREVTKHERDADD